MEEKKKEYLSLSECAEKLGVSTMTITRWYNWYNSDATKTHLVLPAIHRIGANGKKFIEKKDFDVLAKFKKGLRRGMMADYNAAFSWGKNGDRILKEREEDKQTLKEMYKK